ncbi:MAG: DUF1501 domain-containing protein [Planctomycetota bacterium]
MNRRRFLYDSALASTLATFGMSALSQRLLSAANSSRRTASGVGKQCMVLWMQGGPSQIETFAPGEGAGLATSLAGMRTGEMVRAMHPHADKLCVLRSVGGRQGEHVRATHLLHTGFEPVPSFPRPSLGSILSHQIDVDALPRHVLLGDRPFGPAFLPTDSGPFVIADAAAASDQLRRVRERRDAMRHLRRMNTDFESRSPWAMTPDTQQRSNDLEQSSDMSDTALGDVLNVESASQRQRRRYGDTPFGRRTLVASRMLELGVPFVEVQMDGWDTHGENDRRVRGLCDDLLPAWSSLLEDLQKRGRLDDTLVICMGVPLANPPPKRYPRWWSLP